jgi:hypothetical protein
VARIVVAQQEAEHGEQRQEPESNSEHRGYLRCVTAVEQDRSPLPPPDCDGPTIKVVCLGQNT